MKISTKKNITLAVSEVTGAQISEIVMEEIKLILGDCETSTRLQSITTDNGSNIVGACDLFQLEMPHVKIFRCAAHGLNLILKEAMDISDEIKKNRDLILKVLKTFSVWHLCTAFSFLRRRSAFGTSAVSSVHNDGFKLSTANVVY